MASTINRQAAQALLKVLKAKDTSVGQKLRAAELIRIFQKVGETGGPAPSDESPAPEEPTKILEL